MKLIFTLTCICFTLFAKANNTPNAHTQIFQLLSEVNICWSEQHDINNLDIYKITQKKYTDIELIQLHLQLVEKVLRSRSTINLSKKQKLARLKNLDNLHEYWQLNNYPINNKVAYRNTVFIDDYNTFCAVGYLLKTSGNEHLAKEIASSQNLSYLRKIKHPKLNSWVQESGLTLAELAWIQPSYTAKNYSRSLGKGINGPVNALAGDESNKIIYAAGNFSQADSSLMCNNIVKINYDENDIFNNTFSALGDGLNGEVNALFKDGPNLYAGGHFDHSGSTSVNNIAKWNGTTWQAMGVLNGTVYAISKYNNHIYAGGQFLFTKDSTIYQNIAYWDGVTWNPICYSLNGVINALTVFDHKLIVGGAFTIVDSLTVNYLFSYNDTIVGNFIDGITAQVKALDTLSGGIYIGGDLHQNAADTNFFGIQLFYPNIIPQRIIDYQNDIKNKTGVIQTINSISKGYIAGKLFAGGEFSSTNTGYLDFNGLKSFASTNWNGGEVFTILSLGKRVFFGGVFTEVVTGLPTMGSWSYPARNIAVWDPEYVGLNTLDYKEAFFTVTPNPTRNYSIIQSPSNIQSLKVTDITGRIIFETKLVSQQKEYTIERSIFPKCGFYFVNIQTENGTVQSQKLLVD